MGWCAGHLLFPVIPIPRGPCRWSFVGEVPSVGTVPGTSSGRKFRGDLPGEWEVAGARRCAVCFVSCYIRYSSFPDCCSAWNPSSNSSPCPDRS